MIVGIDESGDFRQRTRALFAAVFIRPSERDRVVAAHKGWERRVRKSLGLENELKGHAVPDSFAREFCDEVLYNPEGTPLGYLAFGVDVSPANLAAMDIQRDVYVSGYQQWAEEMSRSSDPDRRKGAGAVRQQGDWIGSLGPVQFLKVMTLGSILPELVEWSLGRSIADGFDEELDSLSILIDRGYIKHDDVAAWRDILRNILIGYTKERPLPFSDQWNDEHPFLRRFVASARGGTVIMTAAFKEIIEFRDSLATPEVRIADVVVSIVRRAELTGEPLPSYRRLREFSYVPHSYKLLEWTTERRPQLPNPYLVFESPESI